jgi:hypothetical protein
MNEAGDREIWGWKGLEREKEANRVVELTYSVAEF